MTDKNKENQQKFEIDVSPLFPIFDDHLKKEDNFRILFSGKFGIGKTFFVNKFFENKNEEYEFFHLYPVNYQINKNEDIIELLKYDILLELIKKDQGDDLFKTNKLNGLKDLILLLYVKIKNGSTVNDSLQYVCSKLGKLGRPLKDILKFDKEWQKFKKEYKKGELLIIEKFKKEIEDKGITETDFFSQFLKNKIDKLKGKIKKSVLILDDLDRIDPEHIFRLLNVFSSFCDNEDSAKNKFGFDRIILVADYYNLKSIFHHRYGKETDFDGYCDKFFSEKVFQFKNQEIIVNSINSLLKEIKIDDEEIYSLINNRSFLSEFLNNILVESIKIEGKEKINLRKLLNFIRFEILKTEDLKFLKRDRLGLNSDEKLIKTIDILISAIINVFSGLEENFIEVINKIKESNDLSDNSSYDTFSYFLLVKMRNGLDDLKRANYKAEDKTVYSIDLNVSQNKITRVFVGRETGQELVQTSKFFFILLNDYIRGGFYIEKN